MRESKDERTQQNARIKDFVLGVGLEKNLVNKSPVIPCYLNFLVAVEALPTLLLPVAAEVVGR